MNLFRRLYVVLSLICLLVLSGCNSVQKQDIHQSRAYTVSELSQDAVLFHKTFSTTHYQIKGQKKISLLSLEEFLLALDPQKEILLGQDIAAISSRWHNAYDHSQKGNIQPLLDIYQFHINRLKSRSQWLEEQLSVFPNSEKAMEGAGFQTRGRGGWFSNSQQADQYWQKQLLDGYLEGKEGGYTHEQIISGLTKGLKTRLSRPSITEQVKIFLNAIAKAYDPDSRYFLFPRDRNINMSLSLRGIGLVLVKNGHETQVARVIEGGPAAGVVSAGDVIAAVSSDGKPFHSVYGWPLDGVIEYLRGPAGSSVKLKLKRSNSPEQLSVVEIARGKIQLKEQQASVDYRTTEFQGSNRKIAIISVPSFYIDFAAYRKKSANYKSVSRDVAAILRSLEKETELVLLDLRNNGGGALQESLNLLALFFDGENPFLVAHNRQGERVLRIKSKSGAEYKGKLAVLVNNQSAGASEIVAAAIQDYGRGIVLGQRTYGLGVIGMLTPMMHGQAKITAGEYFRVNTKPIHIEGITPDLTISAPDPSTTIGQRYKRNNLLTERTVTPVTYSPVNELQQSIVRLNEFKRVGGDSVTHADPVLETALDVLKVW